HWPKHHWTPHFTAAARNETHKGKMAPRSSSPLAALALLALGAFVAVQGPAFLPSAGAPAATQEFDTLRLGAALAAAPAALSSPFMASAATSMPMPVLGIGMLSIIVVIVLVISGLVIARGLLDDEVGGEL
ncbi:unnamed protein product, partial [Polarella glacialis]